MALSYEQIQEILKNPKNKIKIQRAISHEDHLRFHADISIQDIAINGQPLAINDVPYYQKYMQWVNTILTAKDKYDQFTKLLTFPILTNEIIDQISDEYQKVYDAQDSFLNVDFIDKVYLDDFNQYLEISNDTDFWKDSAFKAMMSSISSILIVDVAKEQIESDPEPYQYLLDIRKVLDIGVCDDGEIEYIAFNTEKDVIAFFDDSYYRLYQKTKDNNYILSIENPHDLGYCPARFFWSDILSKDNEIMKHSPISALLSRLDWLLFFETAKEALDIYAAYPIYWAYESKCDYKDPDGHECQGGRVVYWDDNSRKEISRSCPICESKKIVGPGSLIEKPVPRGEMKIDGPPAGIIGIDKTSLEYNVDESERLKNIIITSATGKNKVIAKQAINQDQVQSQFETQTNVLRWIASNFEKAHKWTIDTICKLRYGEKYIGCSISYGTQFYLQSYNEAITDFNTSKTSGIPEYILMSKLNIIEYLQAKNNPKEKSRLEILKALEPYPTMTLSEMKDIGINSIDKEGFVLKANFANFVSKFEREYGSVLEFGSLLAFSVKIDRITEKLREYASSITSKVIDPGAVQ